MNTAKGLVIPIFDTNIGCRPSGFESLSLRHKENKLSEGQFYLFAEKAG
jgi:hypothetical protein